VLDRQIEVRFSLENHIPKGRKITQEEWRNLSAEKNSEKVFGLQKF
jgi:hypothetical protein